MRLQYLLMSCSTLMAMYASGNCPRRCCVVHMASAHAIRSWSARVRCRRVLGERSDSQSRREASAEYSGSVRGAALRVQLVAPQRGEAAWLGVYSA